jgi:Xaa-Pro aminopeptidase
MRFDPISTELLRERRRRVAGLLEGGTLVLPAAPPAVKSRDTEHPYRPSSDLYWLTGLTEPGVVAVLDGGDEPRLTLFVRPRDALAELWSGTRLGPEGAGRVAGVAGTDQVFPLTELDDRLPGILDGAPRIWYRLGGGEEMDRRVREALDRARGRGSRTGSGPRALHDPGPILDELRLIKDAVEIERMREASRITRAGFRALAGALRPGVGEWALEAALEGTFRGEGGDGPAYDSIVGSGASACILHYVENDAVVAPGSLVLVDAGSAFGLYAADITRTFPADGRFTPDQRAVYEVVEAARAAAVGIVAPGVPVGEVHEAAVRAVTEGLVTLGILDGDPADLAEAGAYRPFFPHQTSHWLGLDVHDVGDYAVEGESRPLAPGMVLTVEPGLYFGDALVDAVLGAADPPPEGPMLAGVEAAQEHLAPGAADVLERLRGTGIRIEDDILVTEGGHENLTGELPTGALEVERLVGGGAGVGA